MFIDEIAEYRLLGSFIDDPSYILKVTKEIFTGDRQYIYEAMRKTYSQYGELSSEGIERFYGRPVPAEIEVSRGSKAAAIVDRLVELATKRQIVDMQNELTLALAQNIVDRSKLNQLLQLPPVAYVEDTQLDPGIDRFVALLKRKQSGDYQFVSTGLRWADKMFGGEWPRQGLTVVAGQSGGGKTALLCQSALAMARNGNPVYIASLEMPRDKLVSRFIANMANIDGNKLKEGSINRDEELRANDALLELQTLPIYIEDDQLLSLDRILYSIKNHAAMKGIKAFFVDYLQLIGDSDFSSDENTSRYYGYISFHLRNAAIKEDIAGIVLSQQNRAHKGLNSILGSGRIVNVADAVIELHAADGSVSDESRQYMIEWLKNREGPIGTIGPIFYRPKYLRFDAE